MNKLFIFIIPAGIVVVGLGYSVYLTAEEFKTNDPIVSKTYFMVPQTEQLKQLNNVDILLNVYKNPNKNHNDVSLVFYNSNTYIMHLNIDFDMTIDHDGLIYLSHPKTHITNGKVSFPIQFDRSGSFTVTVNIYDDNTTQQALFLLPPTLSNKSFPTSF